MPGTTPISPTNHIPWGNATLIARSSQTGNQIEFNTANGLTGLTAVSNENGFLSLITGGGVHVSADGLFVDEPALIELTTADGYTSQWAIPPGGGGGGGGGSAFDGDFLSKDGLRVWGANSAFPYQMNLSDGVGYDEIVSSLNQIDGDITNINGSIAAIQALNTTQQQDINTLKSDMAWSSLYVQILSGEIRVMNAANNQNPLPRIGGATASTNLSGWTSGSGASNTYTIRFANGSNTPPAGTRYPLVLFLRFNVNVTSPGDGAWIGIYNPSGSSGRSWGMYPWGVPGVPGQLPYAISLTVVMNSATSVTILGSANPSPSGTS